MAKIKGYKCAVLITMSLCCFACNKLLAQNTYHLRIHYVDSTNADTAKAGIQTIFRDKDECNTYVVRLPSLLQSKGFIAASLDSILPAEKQTILHVFLGQQYRSLQLRMGADEMRYAQAAGYPEHQKQNEVFTFSAYQKLSEKLLDYFEESGYPFAKINLDTMSIQGNEISARLSIDKGGIYKIDSIRMYGSGRISRNFIHHYLDIQPGSAYSRKKLDNINRRLLELPYIQQSRPWDVNMLNTGSIVNLYLQPRRSNQVNVLAGFLPANQQLGGKLLFTIDANLHLQNAFGGGETLGILWQQIQPKSPRLNLQFAQPFLFNSPFGVDVAFDLLKKDSAFLNVNLQLGLLYMLSSTQTGKVIIQSRSTNVLDVDTSIIKATKRLPDVADISTLNIGLNYEYSNTDYKFNPRKGNELSTTILAGNKTIRKNNTISQLKEDGFDYNSLYDTLKLKTYQVKVTARAAHYFKTGKQTVLKTAVNAGLYQSPQYFRNELFQIGGYKTLRGFDEESIYSNRYLIGTLEYRFLLSLNSNFFVFTDAAWSNNGLLQQSNSFLGGGLGLSFETKTGIFNLSYAVGKRNDLNLDVKQSKIHFGFVSIF